jgi:hypothetical protein
MNKEKIIRSSLFASIGISILAAWFKLQHQQVANYLLPVALAVGLFFIITAIYEVSQSRKIDRSEKIMWIIGFLFLTSISGLIYVFRGRKRVV